MSKIYKLDVFFFFEIKSQKLNAIVEDFNVDFLIYILFSRKTKD